MTSASARRAVGPLGGPRELAYGWYEGAGRASAQQFRRYWAVIGPFAGYLMRQWLLLAKRHAERGHPAPEPAAPGSGDDG